MYRVDYARGQWQVLDICGRVVFTGNRQQVEDWLDHQENVQQTGTSTDRQECAGENLRNRLFIDFQIDDGTRTWAGFEGKAELLPGGRSRAGVPVIHLD
jgi:hypothetical protein